MENQFISYLKSSGANVTVPEDVRPRVAGKKTLLAELRMEDRTLRFAEMLELFQELWLSTDGGSTTCPQLTSGL